MRVNLRDTARVVSHHTRSSSAVTNHRCTAAPKAQQPEPRTSCGGGDGLQDELRGAVREGHTAARGEDARLAGRGESQSVDTRYALMRWTARSGAARQKGIPLHPSAAANRVWR